MLVSASATWKSSAVAFLTTRPLPAALDIFYVKLCNMLAPLTAALCVLVIIQWADKVILLRETDTNLAKGIVKNRKYAYLESPKTLTLTNP